MSNEQVTVRRRRSIPKGPFTSEEAEYTITSDLPAGAKPEDMVKHLDSLELQLLDEQLPFPTVTRKTDAQTASPENPYDALPWRQMPKDSKLSWIRFDENPPPLAKQLYEEIMAANGFYRFAGFMYNLSTKKEDGAVFIHRRRP